MNLTGIRHNVWNEGVLVSFLGMIFVSLYGCFPPTTNAQPQDPDAHMHTEQQQPPAGHLKPLGWHRPAEPDVDTVNLVPDPGDFFEKYVRNGRPLLMKGAAKNMEAFKLWTDDYLRYIFALRVKTEKFRPFSFTQYRLS